MKNQPVDLNIFVVARYPEETLHRKIITMPSLHLQTLAVLHWEVKTMIFQLYSTMISIKQKLFSTIFTVFIILKL